MNTYSKFDSKRLRVATAAGKSKTGMRDPDIIQPPLSNRRHGGRRHNATPLARDWGNRHLAQYGFHLRGLTAVVCILRAGIIGPGLFSGQNGMTNTLYGGALMRLASPAGVPVPGVSAFQTITETDLRDQDQLTRNRQDAYTHTRAWSLT